MSLISGVIQSGDVGIVADVWVIRNDTKVPVQNVTTGSDGVYSFTGLEDGVLYDVLAYDPSGVWEAKVSSKRTAG